MKRALLMMGACLSISIAVATHVGPVSAAEANRVVSATAQAQISATEAHDIAVDAYVYLYPLVTMDITRRQSTNIAPGKDLSKGPMNMFINLPEYPSAQFKTVVRPNFDTLYSISWLDISREPMIVTVPDTGGRYYLLPMLDMWTDVFASPGSRTTGTGVGNFAIIPPGWQGTLPQDIRRIDAPTRYVWIIGRTKTDGPADYAAVHKIQAGYKVTPLSQWGRDYQSPSVNIDPTVDMKTPPKTQVDRMSARDFFAYAAELLKINPPHVTDQPIVAQIERIGIVPGKSFDFSALDPAIREAIANAPADAQNLMAWKLPTLARAANGWSMNTDTMGVYGNYYLKRALIAQIGLGANLPEDAIYPLNLADETGKPLDGANRYILHFDKGATPPAKAFWSVTLYDSEGFAVANPLNRSAVSSWMPFRYNDDGSLDLYFQNDSPGKGREQNWLPSPKGPFNLTMRIYAPGDEVLVGKWNPPPVRREPGTAAVTPPGASTQLPN